MQMELFRVLRVISLAFALATVVPNISKAETSLIYGRDGKITTVIRSSPSGAIIYDGSGKIVETIRQPHRPSLNVVEVVRPRIHVIGTTLSGGVGGSIGGVGLN